MVTDTPLTRRENTILMAIDVEIADAYQLFIFSRISRLRPIKSRVQQLWNRSIKLRTVVNVSPRMLFGRFL